MGRGGGEGKGTIRCCQISNSFRFCETLGMCVACTCGVLILSRRPGFWRWKLVQNLQFYWQNVSRPGIQRSKLARIGQKFAKSQLILRFQKSPDFFFFAILPALWDSTNRTGGRGGGRAGRFASANSSNPASSPILTNGSGGSDPFPIRPTAAFLLLFCFALLWACVCIFSYGWCQSARQVRLIQNNLIGRGGSGREMESEGAHTGIGRIETHVRCTLNFSCEWAPRSHRSAPSR